MPPHAFASRASVPLTMSTPDWNQRYAAGPTIELTPQPSTVASERT